MAVVRVSGPAAAARRKLEVWLAGGGGGGEAAARQVGGGPAIFSEGGKIPQPETGKDKEGQAGPGTYQMS